VPICHQVEDDEDMVLVLDLRHGGCGPVPPKPSMCGRAGTGAGRMGEPAVTWLRRAGLADLVEKLADGAVPSAAGWVREECEKSRPPALGYPDAEPMAAGRA